MLVQFECHECILKQLVALAREAGKDDAHRLHLVRDFLDFFYRESPRSTPPEIAAYLFGVYCRELGNPDPFLEKKDRSTQIGRELFSEFELLIRRSPDPFLSLLKVVIGGNLIDYGVNPNFDLESAAEEIRRVTEWDVDAAAAAELKKRMEQAKKVLYILDNCGEAVFDRFLLEPIRDKVTLGVRGRAILNDVTRRELSDSGLEGFPVVDTGDGAPGVSLRSTSPDFLNAMKESDLIIAKGQGNFESLEGEFTARPLFFLFRAKCPVIQRYLHVPPASLQILGRNLQKTI